MAQRGDLERSGHVARGGEKRAPYAVAAAQTRHVGVVLEAAFDRLDELRVALDLLVVLGERRRRMRRSR